MRGQSVCGHSRACVWPPDALDTQRLQLSVATGQSVPYYLPFHNTNLLASTNSTIMAGKFDVEELERTWKWSEGDPEELFVLEEEIASGSFGSVYKVRFYRLSSSFYFSSTSLLPVCYLLSDPALHFSTHFRH